MARSQAANLTGLLSNIANTAGAMGDVGNQYVDTFRRTMAPKVDMNDADSLMNYADYARRNGYDDEAKQYMVLGATQQKAQDQKSYADQLATGTEKLRGLYGQLGVLRGTKGVDPSAITALENNIVAIENKLNEAGENSIYGVANAGSTASRTVTTEIAAQQKAQLESTKLRTDVDLKKSQLEDLVAQGKQIDYAEHLPYIDGESYVRAWNAALTDADRAKVNERYAAQNSAMKTAKDAENKTIANAQVQVVYQDMLNEGTGLVNDDELTDFLQELDKESKKAIDEVVIASAMGDPKWLRGDAETQREIIEKHFVDQYSQLYRDSFGVSLGKREAGKSLETSDQLANYKEGANPDVPAESGGAKEQFESWYASEKQMNPAYTIEEAREDWDKQYKR